MIDQQAVQLFMNQIGLMLQMGQQIHREMASQAQSHVPVWVGVLLLLLSIHGFMVPLTYHALCADSPPKDQWGRFLIMLGANFWFILIVIGILLHQNDQRRMGELEEMLRGVRSALREIDPKELDQIAYLDRKKRRIVREIEELRNQLAR